MRVRRIGFEPRQDADSVAGRSQRELASQNDEVHVGQQMREVDQHVARQIDHGHFERLAEFFLQLHESRTIGHQRLVDRSLCRQDRQIIIGADHGAFDEQAVNTAWVIDCVGQAAARLKVQCQRAGSKVHVEIEQRSRSLMLVAEQPCERGCERRSADTTTRPDHSGRNVPLDRFAFTSLRRSEDGQSLVQSIVHLLGRKWLQQVVVDAAGKQIAIQAHVVDLAHGDNHGARLADFCQRVDIVQRIAAFRKVDHEDCRAGADAERLDRIAQAAFVALLRLPAHFDDDGTQNVQRVVIADIGCKRIAIAGKTGFPGSVHGLVSSAFTLCILQTGSAGWCCFTIGRDCLVRSCNDVFTAAFLAFEQVLWIGDHRSEVAVYRATVAGAGRVHVVAVSLGRPIGAARNRSGRTGDHHAGLTRLDESSGRRSGFANDQTITTGKFVDCAGHGWIARWVIDSNAVTVGKTHRVEPAFQPLLFRNRESAAIGLHIERVVRAFDHCLLVTVKARIGRHSCTTRDREAKREGECARQLAVFCKGHRIHLSHVRG